MLIHSSLIIITTVSPVTNPSIIRSIIHQGALWLHTALLRHKSRVSRPDDAKLFIVPIDAYVSFKVVKVIGVVVVGVVVSNGAVKGLLV